MVVTSRLIFKGDFISQFLGLVRYRPMGQSSSVQKQPSLEWSDLLMFDKKVSTHASEQQV